MIARLRESGVTIILTTHYIEAAKDIADRIAVINSGEILLIEDKNALMKKRGKKQLRIELKDPITQLPSNLSEFHLDMSDSGNTLTYTFDASESSTGITRLLSAISQSELQIKDLNTSQSSLEDIFVDLVKKPQTEAK